MRNWKVALAATLVVAAGAGPASAQIWVGQIAAATSRIVDEQREALCPTQRVFPGYVYAGSTRGAQAVMTKYFAAAATADQRGVKALFFNGPRSGFYDGPTLLGRDARDPFARPVSPAPQATIVKLVIGNDSKSARGVWLVQWPAQDASSPPVNAYYVADLRSAGWMSPWRIYRLRVAAEAPRPEDVPDMFCHGQYLSWAGIIGEKAMVSGVEDADLPPKAADGPAPAASDAPAETAPASSTDQPRRLPEADKQGTQP